MEKSLFYLFASIVFINNIIAQELSSSESSKSEKSKPNYPQHEINVGFTNLFNSRFSFLEDIFYLEYYDGYYPDDIYDTPFFFEGMGINATRYGLGYKFHLTKSSIRSYIDMGINNNSNKNNSNGSSFSNSPEIKSNHSWSSKLITCRLGYEFIINKNKTDFYYGIDAVYQYSSWKYKYEKETNNTQNNYSTFTESNSKATYQAYGCGVFIGIKYQISEMISISTETRIDVLGYQQKGDKETSTRSLPQSYNSTTNFENFSSSGLRSKVSPLGLVSLNVHL